MTSLAGRFESFGAALQEDQFMHQRSLLGFTWAVFCASLIACGCSSDPKGPGRTAKAVDSLGDTKKHVADATKQVAETNDSLRKLADASGGDLRPMFNK